MPLQITSGAMMACSFGVAPSAINVLPANKVTAGGAPAATIMDHAPTTNIMPFGMCSAPSNPAVIAATSAALGVPTPAPCIPATPAPWTPGVPKVMIGGMPALNQSCKLACLWGGMIQFTAPSQTTVMD